MTEILFIYFFVAAVLVFCILKKLHVRHIDYDIKYIFLNRCDQTIIHPLITEMIVKYGSFEPHQITYLTPLSLNFTLF